MWSHSGSVSSNGPVAINYFVPLPPKRVSAGVTDSVINVDECAGGACVEGASLQAVTMKASIVDRSTVNAVDRAAVFHQCWRLGNWEHQTGYVLSSVQITAVK